ncbi:uncharacterized protein LOC133287384 [Gastrolobium bilobum]|uniref:uncharacterized protein LOC133287384 n=1 Tax=Gastrolobium bilobum TaxID=150636 RepID=UPI002AB1EBFF|nr:uncharacterized protein LOC133287384 [Gastrolobium bilobum]
MSFPFGEMLSHHEESWGCSSLVQLFCFDSIWNTQKVSLLKSSITTANKTLLSGKEEKQHDECPWTSLPDDIMELIMKRLCLEDCLGLREICTPWRDTVANAIANKHCHPLPELPLLVLFNPLLKLPVLGLFTHCQPSPVFSLRTEGLLYPKRRLLETLQTIRGSVEGWMIVSEYSNLLSLSLSLTIFFFNPVTNAKVFVPSVLKFPSNSPLQADKLLLKKMVASSKPDCLDCFLVGLFSDYCHIRFCRLSDKSWTTIEADKDTGVHFMDVEIIDTKLYATTSNSILVWDLQDSSDYPPKPKLLATVPPRPRVISTVTGSQRFDRGIVYDSLAKDDALGDLFLIHMFINVAYETRHVGYLNIVTEFVAPLELTRVEVFKLNTSNETNQWIKVDNLGDLVLFRDSTKCMVMSRASLNSSEELIKENSIYFGLSYACAGDPSKSIQLGMICLTDNSIKYFTLEKSSPRPLPFWFVPSV